MKHFLRLLALACLVHPPAALAAGPRIVASIKPLHSLVASVMGDTGEPALLVGGAQSPHGFQLKPSQVEMLQHADVVFYISPSFETFLTRALAAAPASVQAFAMADAPGITLLKVRESGVWEPDLDEETAPPGKNGRYDIHLWLSTANARAMLRFIAATLSARYPENAKTYAANAAATITRLDALETSLKTQLAPVKAQPYIVFHDAFQYFEREFGLNGAGSITLEPEQVPSAKRVGEVRKKVRAGKVACVFSEPQFDARLAANVAEGSAAKSGVLDEHGATLTPGPNLYFTLMQQLADGIGGCLGGRG